MKSCADEEVTQSAASAKSWAVSRGEAGAEDGISAQGWMQTAENSTDRGFSGPRVDEGFVVRVEAPAMAGA